MSRQYRNKASFLKWVSQNNLSVDISIAEKCVVDYLKQQGVSNPDLFAINNPIIVCSYATDIISKREQNKTKSINEYSQAILLMVVYSEFLAVKDKDKNKQGLNNQRKTRDSLIVAYCLSRLNMEAVYALGYETFKSAFCGLGKVLGQKPNTIKNMRDEFDPYFDNGRVGWYQRKLRASRKQVFDDMELIDDQELMRITNEIINRYNKQPASSENGSHQTIKISNKNMKTHNAAKK